MQPLLTIAIPTYNRAAKLEVLLRQLTNDVAYNSSKIEIIVSDNASTDNTSKIVKEFPSVRYHRNEENIGFGNFTVAMELATGCYTRLMNDTARFNSNMLGSMLEIISQTDSRHENIIFANELISIKQGIFTTKGKDALIDRMSFFITWIGNFGMWTEDFRAIRDKDRMVETLMQHVDWMLYMAGNGKQTKIIVDRFLEVEPIKNKGRYDIFDTFINKYFSILKYHNISRFYFAKEKYKLFRYFIIDWYLLLKKDKEYTFDVSGVNIIWKHYWYEPYFTPIYFIKWSRYKYK